MRIRGFGEGSFWALLQRSSDSWLPLPRPVVNWGGAVCSCEDRMLLLLLGFPMGQIVLLFIVLCFQGKQHLCVCVCMCTHACMHCVYVKIWWASQNHRRVASCSSNLPKISLVTAFLLTLLKAPHFFILPLLEGPYLRSTCQ